MATRHLALWVLAAVSCANTENDLKFNCEETLRVWADDDGDGFGGEELEEACALPEGTVGVGLDCNDNDDTIHPDGEEICDAIDNDCDGQIDQGLEGITTYYTDDDQDGFGVQFPAMTSCADPGDGWADNADDCDDADPAINPEGTEVCNGGIDDDCDGLEDDFDSSLDPTTQPSWYIDADGDGYGSEAEILLSCTGVAGYVDNADDCADDNPDRSPNIQEVCSGFDEDCDELIDDEDPDVDPASQTEFFEDADDDGYGSTHIVLACEVGLGAADNDWDCDDTDPTETVDTDWYADLDGDGFGQGPSVAFQCLNPYPGLAAPNRDDCRDDDPTINPDAAEVCDDKIDHDCDGNANCCDASVEVIYNDTCYYLDGSGGYCDPGYELAPQSVLNTIAQDFVGLDYKNAVSGNCCIWHADQAAQLQDWGMSLDCNTPGPFDGGPSLGGAGCFNALNLNATQLTLCRSQ